MYYVGNDNGSVMSVYECTITKEMVHCNRLAAAGEGRLKMECIILHCSRSSGNI